MNLQLQVRTGNRYSTLNINQISPKHLSVTFPYNPELVKEVKAWEGAAWKPDTKEWHVDLTERNLYCIRMLTEGRDPHYHREIQHVFTSGMFIRPLMLHQKEDVDNILQKKRMIEAAEPGVGKTLIAIEVMERISGYYWIIVPKSAKDVWLHELRKWKAKCTNLDTTYGSVQPLPTRIRIIPMNQLVSALTKLKELPNNIIVDEAHFFKNPSAKRTEALLALAAYVRKNNGVVLPMTGTPSPKDPSDWWTLVEMCQPGYLRESTKKKLLYRLAITEDMGDYKKIIGWDREEVEKLYRRLQGIVNIRLAKDCIDLPPIIYKVQRFEPEPEIKRAAELIKKTSNRAITALIRLRQLSDGFQPENACRGCEGEGYTDVPDLGKIKCPACDGRGFSGQVSLITPKDEALLEYLNEDRDRIVIYAGFHASIDKIERMCRETGWKIIKVDGRGTTIDPSLPQNTQEAFETGTGKIAYIGHPTAGGVSITLTKSQIIIFYSNDFNGASRMQAIKRIHRIGSTKAVIVDFVWLPSDQLVLDNLNDKRDLQAITLGQINDYWDRMEQENDN